MTCDDSIVCPPLGPRRRAIESRSGPGVGIAPRQEVQTDFGLNLGRSRVATGRGVLCRRPHIGPNRTTVRFWGVSDRFAPVDYGHDLEFGVFLSPDALAASRTLELA